MEHLWKQTLQHLSEGNFTALEQMLGGPEGFDRQITEWHEAGKFADELELLAEALSCACMLGRNETAQYLIDAGVDPYSGMKTGLAGPHYAVSSGHLETVRMLLNNGIDLKVENMYGGTIWGQALWSAVHEPKAHHPEIIDQLLSSGAIAESGTKQWWSEQNVPTDRKRSIASILERHRVE